MQQQLIGRVISAAVHEVMQAGLRQERYTGNPYASPLFWQDVADEIHAKGFKTERVGFRCLVCREPVLLSQAAPVAGERHLCDECAKAARA